MMRTMMSFCFACVCSAAGARAETFNMEFENAARIYGPVFSNITAWAAAHTNISLTATNNFAGPEADAAYRDLLPQVEALGAADQATFCNWGTRFEDGVAALVPYVSPAMRAARAAQWVASYEAANGIPQFGNHALEALRVARNCGEDRLLISLLVQIANEKKALDFLAAHVGEMDAGELDALERKLAAMPPGATMIEAMQMEKAMLVDNLIRQVLEAMREGDTNLFETVGDEIAGGTNSTGATGSTTRVHSWLSENLRLTSIVDSGGRYKIGFETKDGDSFVLALGRPQRGIEMLSVDYVREEAVIARSNETAMVRLKSREISPLRLRLRMPTQQQVSAMNSEPPNTKHKAFQQLVLTLSALSHGSDAGTNSLLTAAGGTGDGLLRLLQKTSDEYAEWIAAFQRMPLAEFKTWQNDFLKRGTMLTQQMLPAVDKVAEKEKQMLESREKLGAAIAARRAALRAK